MPERLLHDSDTTSQPSEDPPVPDGAIAPVPDLPDVPPGTEEIVAKVEGRIRELVEGERRRWSRIDPALDLPFESLAEFVERGGKRLRPLFCYWGFRAAGGDPEDPGVVEAGAAFEVLHAFALAHDDVMDGSDTRRRLPTIHRDFHNRHSTNDWRGEGRRFGEGAAILIGDLALVYADSLMRWAPPEALDVWHELKVEVNVGQYLDLVGSASGGVGMEESRRIALYKSGKYTIERPLHVGAALAGGLGRFGATLSAYGAPLGEAFQLRDDVLGAFGDPSVTGKPVGDDLRQGKPTPLLAVARSRSEGRDRTLLDRVGAPDLTDDEVVAIQELISANGAAAEIEERISELTGAAVTAVAGADVEPEVAEALADMARWVTARDA